MARSLGTRTAVVHDEQRTVQITIALPVDGGGTVSAQRERVTKDGEVRTITSLPTINRHIHEIEDEAVELDNGKKITFQQWLDAAESFFDRLEEGDETKRASDIEAAQNRSEKHQARINATANARKPGL